MLGSKINHLLIVGMVVFLPRIVSAQNLDEVVSAAISHSPNLKAQHAQIDGANSQFREIRALRYPRLSIRSSYMRGDNPVYAFGSLLEQGAFGPQNFAIDKLNNPTYLTNFKNALDVGVPLFTAFDISTGEKIRRFAVAQAQAGYEATLQSTRFLVVQAYLDALLKKELLAEVDQRIESAGNEVDGARRLNAKGLVLGSDYFAAEAILSGLRAQRARYEQELLIARKRVSVLSGLAMESIAFSGKLGPASYSLASEDVLTERALLARQDAVNAELSVKMADIGLKHASNSYLPTIEAFGSIETNTNDFESNPTNRTVGVRSNFPIGDPAYFSRKTSARASIKERSGQRDQILEGIRLDVAEARGQLQGIMSAVALVEESARQADKSLNLFRPLYREGRQSILDVLRAEEGLMRARQALLETYFHVHLGYARLCLVTGELEAETIKLIEKNIEVEP
jgi:outer membrane protein TolC